MSNCKKDSSSSSSNNNNIPKNAPELTTTVVTFVSTTTAVSGGTVTNDNGFAVTERGICLSTNQNPTIANSRTSDGNGSGSFTSIIKYLTPNITYFVRAYATNSAGTGYGSAISFTTQQAYGGSCGNVTDADGNVYNTITIGTQCWFKQNLKTTKYNDGSGIPNITDNTAWTNLTTPAYCWYNNDATTNKGTYGALYNWYAVNTGKLCPTGWHVPSDAERSTLKDYLGGMYAAVGGKMKSTGTIEEGTGLWHSPNSQADNSTAFTFLPGGYREENDGSFKWMGSFANVWSSTESNENTAWAWILNYYDGGMGENTLHKTYGFSLRCIKDN